jgi:hypothetical protein
MTSAQPMDGPPRFRRQARAARQPSGSAFSAEPLSADSAKSVQDLRAGLRKQTVRVTNRPARFPPTGVWPFELRADMVAALLDFDTTRQLCKANRHRLRVNGLDGRIHRRSGGTGQSVAIADGRATVGESLED